MVLYAWPVYVAFLGTLRSGTDVLAVRAVAGDPTLPPPFDQVKERRRVPTK